MRCRSDAARRARRVRDPGAHRAVRAGPPQGHRRSAPGAAWGDVMIINADHVARDVVVVAASAGSLLPLRALCASLAPDLPAVLAIVFHRNPYSDGKILPILRRESRLPIVEPRDGERVEK